MKITDVSSAPNAEEEPSTQASSEPRKKRSLLEKYNIPVEELDFEYVKKCTDPVKVERILRIMRSGEEGHYPRLEECVETRLEQLNPRSRLLRVETPALLSRDLNKEDREGINSGITEWLETFIHQNKECSSRRSCDIFSHQEKDAFEAHSLPVRGSSQATVLEVSNKKPVPSSSGESQRIKSWEYDKWSKYDVDAELTKMDITDMQCEEWERRERPKLIAEQQQVDKLMKNKDPPVQPGPLSTVKASDGNVKKSTTTAINEKSYIEEIDEDDDEKGTTVQMTGRSFMRTKVTIEDLNLKY